MKLAGLVLVGLASGCFGDAMTGPRRIQRQGRSQEASPMDWEYGGWRPLQTPKGFYRRISRNLLKDDESRLLNEIGEDGDLEASSSKLHHARALEDFLKSGPECGGCGFQPMLFHHRAERRARSAPPASTIDNPQRIGSHQEDMISITDALKQKLRDRHTIKRGRREANQISASPTAASTDSSEAARNDALDEAKTDKITQDDEEPHFLSPGAILGLTKKLAEAIASKESSSSGKTSQIASEIPNTKTAAQQGPHFLSPAGVAAVEKEILETLIREPAQESKESASTAKSPVSAEDPASKDDTPHFLSRTAVGSVVRGVLEAASKPERPAIRSRMKRQIWNPFRRRQPVPKPSGGPFGFVNQNVPYEAQSSIDNFNFAQSIPQNSFQGNGFQSLQSFVPASHPPITNFDKVPAIEFQKPLPPQEFAPPPQFVPEPEIVPPVPTRPIKRPEQIQPPKRNVAQPPPPHVVDEILSQFQRTGMFPPDLSPETALLIAEILSGKKQNVAADPSESVSPAIDNPPPFVEPAKSQRDPAPLPDFHIKPLASPPVSFGSLPPAPPKSSFAGISRSKTTPIAASHSASHEYIVPHGHDGVHLNSEGFQRPHTVTTVTTRKRKKPLPPLTESKLSDAEKAAEHSVEKDHHTSIFPQEHVHIHHHHKKKKRRPSPAPTVHLPPSIPTSEILLAPAEHTLSEYHEHSSHHVPSRDSLVNAKVHLDTKSSHGPALSLEAELGADTKPHPVTVDPLQSLDEVPAEKPDLSNAEYYDDIFHRKSTSAPVTTQAPQWPVDDPFLNPSTSTEGPQTVGPEDILIQDAKPGIPMMASDLNSLKTKTKSSGPLESLPQPVFRPDIQTKKANEAAKQANQDEDDISAGAGAIHFQPIQTKEGEANSATGNAQLYHAYYAPAHHDPPPGYIRMTVDEFNKLFKDAEIQFIGSEQELQKKLGTKPTNKLNFDITKEGKEEEKDAKDAKHSSDSGKETAGDEARQSQR